MKGSRSRTRPGRLLLLLGLASLAGYLYAGLGLAATGRPVELFAFLGLFGALFVVYAGAYLGCREHPLRRRDFLLIFGFAALYRLALLPVGLPQDEPLAAIQRDLGRGPVSFETFLLYDNDVWRYLWDGRLTQAAIDPYRASPAEHEAFWESGEAGTEISQMFEEARWQDIYEAMGYREQTTVYGPLAQGLFALSSWLRPGSVLVWKGLTVLVDLATCVVVGLLGVRLGRGYGPLLLYSWNPLVIKEFAGSGHVDALLVLLLVLMYAAWADEQLELAAIALGAASLVKVSALVLWPLLLRQTPWRRAFWLPLTVFVGFVPFLSSAPKLLSGLWTFAGQWVFNPGPWALAEWIGHEAGLSGRWAADLMSLLVLAAVLVFWLYKPPSQPGGRAVACLSVLGTLVVVAPAVMPWYLSWALPFAALRVAAPWLVLTALSLLSYLVYIDQVERSWWLWVEYGVFFGLLMIAALWRTWRARRHGSAGT